ncbi:ABC transporter permease [Tistrella mobilis]|uniref:Binding-protein-dependent transport systems inner membrane component n=1 Tax=Tistrella mobilis (strain KA081020-065) TaxID=1110502 RepID=I3THN7_TISMK|nr:ABC transporter permease [Tistrella mobilis]AFK52275.1 binding-protein-dependent transport systems inner membrane component [Tistrella mobilis KA081020-065]
MSAGGTTPRSKRLLLWSVIGFDLLILALPTLIVLGASFTAGNIVTFPPDGLSLQWYEKVVGAYELRQAFWRSLWVAVVCTLISLPAGTLAAIALARWRIAFGRTLQVYLLLPFTVPLIASGIGMMLLFGRIGILGQLWPVGLACAVINLPFMIWAVGASVNALDPDLENAAANCGAPPVQTFLTVTLPAVMPGVITGALLMFVLAFNEFLVSLLLVDARIVTLPVQIYNSIRSVITPDLAAVSVVYILVAALAIRALDKLVGLDLFLRSK